MQFVAIAPLLFMLAGIVLASAGMIPAMYGWGLMALGALFGLAVSLTILLTRARKGQSRFRLFAIVALLPLGRGRANCSP